MELVLFHVLHIGGVVRPENLEGSKRRRDLSPIGPHGQSRASLSHSISHFIRSTTLSHSAALSLSSSLPLSPFNPATHCCRALTERGDSAAGLAGISATWAIGDGVGDLRHCTAQRER